MVAIFVGQGAGFTRGSANLLGGAGLLGSGSFGRAGENVSVNAATGNLLITQQDEFLVGKGLDIAIGRTYNSMGDALDGDNGDNWQQSTMRRVFGLTGTQNTAGSTIKRQGADGAVVTYTWNATRSAYLSTDGEGAHDELKKVGATWVWTEGSSRFTDTYSAYGTDNWRITSATDNESFGLTFTYIADKLDKVTTATVGGGDWTQYVWSGNKITQIVTGYTDLATSTAKTLTRTRYAYDGSNRLYTVTIDLSPQDNYIVDNRTFVTTYTYDGSSTRVASISTTGGASIAIVYDGLNRVQTMTETVDTGLTRVTSFAYDATHTDVTGPDGKTTRLEYDASKRLTKLTLPAATGTGFGQFAEFEYDADGNVTKVTDTADKDTSYTYDASGNVLTTTDANSNVVTRTYSAKNELLTETRTIIDESGATVNLTTRYAYDSASHLRYIVSAEGFVTEFEWASGNQYWTTEYPQQAYDISALASNQSITESQLMTWRTTFDNTRDKIVSEQFDARGNMTKRTRYGKGATNWGSGSQLEGYSETFYAYDQAGRLLSQYDNGVLADVFVYDGMGRVVAASNAAAGLTTYRFDDANTTTIVHHADGLTQTKVYNKAGDLLSEMSATPGYQPDELFPDLNAWTKVGVTQAAATPIDGKPAYSYTLNATGSPGVVAKSMSVAAGETVSWRIAVKGSPTDVHRLGLHGSIATWGSITGSDASATIISGPGVAKNVGVYGTLFELSGLSTTQETIIEIRGTFAQAQGVYAYFYVGVGASVPAGTTVTLGANNLTRTVSDLDEAISSTTAYRYDALGRVRMITTPRGVATTGDANDYNSFILYNHSGQRTADIAADGSIVEYRYDAAGRLAATIAYATKLNSTQLVALAAAGGIAEVATYRPTGVAADVCSWNIYDVAGRLVQTIAGDGGVTNFSYDKAGRLITTIVYVNKVTVTSYKTTPPTSPVTPTPASGIDRVIRNFYDRDGRLVGALDGEGYLSEVVYDKAGQKVEEIGYSTRPTVNLLTSSFSALKSSAGTSVTSNRRIHYVYDGQGLLRYQVNGLGQVTSFAYDKAQQLTTTIVHAATISPADFTYASVKIAVTAIASDTNDRENFTIYNAEGQAAYTVDAAGRVVAFAYDVAGRVIKTLEFATLRATTNLESLATMDSWAASNAGHSDNRITRSYWNAAGELRFTIDSEGYVTRFAYDPDGNLVEEVRFATAISVTDATTIAGVDTLATGNSITISHLYDANGRRYATIDGEGFQTRREWDGAGNLVAVHDAYESTTLTDRVRTDYTYNGAGRLLSETRAAGAGEASTVQYSYDGLGNLTSVTDPLGKITYNYYDDIGQLIAVRDAAAHVTRMSYNAFGEVVSATRFANTTASLVSDPPVVTADAAKDVVTYSFYDRLGRLTYTVDGEKYVTRSYYNSFGDVVKTVRYATTYNATATTTIADLDTAFGNEATTPPASATVTSYAYDKRGQVLTVTEAVASGASLVTTSTYDAFGQLKTVTRDAATTSFDYDRRGLVKKTTDAELFFESYTYDAYGNRVSVTAKSKDGNKVAGGTTVYTYDKRGLLLTETLPIAAYLANGTEQAATITNKYSYDGRGNRTQVIEAFGLTEARTTGFAYDKLDRLTKTTHQIFQGYAPEDHIAYDAAGNVVRTTDAAGSRTVYFYDDLGRKRVSVDMAGTYSSFTYDAHGNLTETRVYESQLTSIPANGGLLNAAPAAPTVPTSAYRITTFAYDRLGRLKTSNVAGVSGGSWNTDTDAWDAYNNATLTTSYVYDAFGNVIKATDANGNVTRNWYDLLGRKTAQADAANYLTKWTYDAEGNVLTEKRYSLAISAPADGHPEPAAPGGDTAIRETRFTYDKNGNRRSEERRDVAVHNDASPGTTTIVHAKIEWLYNGLGQVVRKIEATGDQTNYSYDAGGRLKKEERATFVSHQGSNVTPTVEYFYNGLGDLAGTLAAGVSGDVAARATTYSYSGGKLVQMTDAAGFVRNYKYDIMGRVTHDYYTRLGSSGSAANAYEGTLTQYDVLGRIVKQWQATSANATSWTAATPVVSTLYNAFGEVAKTGVNAASVADGDRVWQTENKYDAAGRVWATNAGDGVWKYFVYDKNGNQTLAITSAGEDLTNKTIDQAIALIGETDVNATYTRYDARNLAWATHEEDRQLGLGNVQDLDSQRVYNGFGEVLTETNALGATVSYTYNNMGRVIRREGPTVQIKLEDGTTRWVKPSEDFYYDRSGRLVAKLDANGTYAAGGTESAGTSKAANTGNLTRLTLLAGTGYDGGQAMVTQEIHADDGIKTSRYDIHGDVRVVLDEISRQSTQSFDAMGRVTQVTHASGLVDNYSYDGLGQLLVHWNSVLGSGNKETTDYDVQGRVVSARAYGGDETTTSYVWDATIGASGMGITPGGWVITTSTIADRASGSDTIFAIVEKTDLFDRTVDRVDAGGQDFDYGFDFVGRLLSEESENYYGNALRHKAYTYFNTGRIETISSGDVAAVNTDWERNRTTYAYDVMGNQTYEKLDRLWGIYTPEHTIWHGPGEPEIIPESYDTGTDLIRFGTAHYDLLGRMDNYVDNAVSGSANVDKDWFYDANGNVRHINTAFRAMQANGTLATSQSSVDYYYLYDSMNRLVRSKGALSGGAIVRGAVGTDMTYDDAGQRMTAQTGSGVQESYTYNNAGLVTDVTISGVTRATTSFNALGQIIGQSERDAGNNVVYNRYDIVYDARNQIIAEKSSTKEGSDWIYAHLVNHYSADGTGSVGVITSSAAQGTSTGSVLFHSETKYWKNGSSSPVYGPPYSSADTDYPDAYTDYSYAWSDGPLQQYVTLINRDGTTQSQYTYNREYQLVQVQLTGGARPRTITYGNNAGGQIISRREADGNSSLNDPSSRSYFFAGKQMGEVTNNGNENVDYATWIANRTNVDGSGPFQEGSNTASTFADFDQNYVAMNGGTQDSTPGVYRVRSGDTLQAIAAQLWGDASLWYKIAEANGLSGTEALIEGRSLSIPSGLNNIHHTADTFKAYDPAKAVGDVNPNTPKPPKKKGCGVFGMILVAAVAIGLSVWLGPQFIQAAQGFLGSTFAGAVVGGAAAGAVSSAVSQGFGIAIGAQEKFSWKNVGLAAIAGGIGGAVAPNGGFGADGLFGKGTVAAIGRAVVSNVVSQGISVATGLQKKFDWAGVAAAGVGAGIGDFVGGKIDGRIGSQFAEELVSNTAAAITSAAARSAIKGNSFGDNLLQAIPDIIGQAIGRALAGSGSSGGGSKIDDDLDPKAKAAGKGTVGSRVAADALGGYANPAAWAPYGDYGDYGDHGGGIKWKDGVWYNQNQAKGGDPDWTYHKFTQRGADQEVEITIRALTSGRDSKNTWLKRIDGYIASHASRGDKFSYDANVALRASVAQGAFDIYLVPKTSSSAPIRQASASWGNTITVSGTRIQREALPSVEVVSVNGGGIVTVQDASALASSGGSTWTDIKTGVGDFFSGVIAGDASSSNSTAAEIGKALGGLIPFADIRDIGTAAYGVYNGDKGAWSTLGIAALGAVPVIGDAGKQILKHGDEVLDAFGEARRVGGRPVSGPSVAAESAPSVRAYADGSWRTADGKFASPLGAGRPGSSAEAAVWDAVDAKPGWSAVRGQVAVRDASGQLRYYDGAAISPRGRVIGLETKSGTATRTPEQRLFDSTLNSNPFNVATGVGQSKGTTVQRSILIRVP